MTAAARTESRLPSIDEETRAFRRLELRIVRTLLRHTLSTARLRLTLVVLLSLLLWAGLYVIMREGFSFLRITVMQPMRDQIVQTVFNTFFFTLMVMLVFSSSIILYGSLFRSREVSLLLTYPVRDARLFLFKFQQAVFLSSWGFLLLGSPMLVAYGVVVQAPWYYYAALAPMMAAFVYVPVGLGAIACLEVMRRAPRKRGLVLAAAVAVLVAAGGWFLWSLILRPEGDLLKAYWYQDMLGRLQITDQRLLPNWWLSSGLLEMADGAWTEGVLFLLLMISNALFFRLMAAWIAAKNYRRTYSAVAGAGSVRRRVHQAWLDRLLGLPLAILPTRIRLMLVKDLRIFRRDPAQWSQFVILLGLLALYFANVRPLASGLLYANWVSMVSFMNLSVVGLLMSTFTTRFIFPMISLEGRRFWLLGLLPLRRETILWSKFLFAIGFLFLPGQALVLLSDAMLRMPPLILGCHQAACALLCFGLSGIAVGLGARLPNLREQSPSRIAAGFGGTLNLVVSTIFIVAVLLLMPLPYHLYQATHDTSGAARLTELTRLVAWLPTWLVGGTVLSCVLGAAATAVPLWIGLRAFRRLEMA
jgi:ABC-2 type transport system permease protein